MLEMERHARFSRCGRFRTALSRCWDGGLPRIAFIGLNPSTADAHQDDPTLRRCMGFARREGAGSLVVVNLFGFRATRPADLWAAGAPVGASTDRVLRQELRECALVVLCWGNLPSWAVGRAQTVLGMVDLVGLPPMHLGLTRAGHPRHPLYTRAVAPLHPWETAQRRAPYV